MSFELSEDQIAIREAVFKSCTRFDDAYWLERDNKHEFPHDFARAMADAGWLGTVMPERYGGAGLGWLEGTIVLEAIAESGAGMAGCAAIHQNMFGPMAIVRHGSEEQKERWISRLITLTDRSCFGVTEPGVGLDTTRLACKAEWDGKRQRYLVSGQKIWTSSAQQANKVMLLVRTTPIEKCAKPMDGISLFYTDLDRKYVEIREIPKMGRHSVDSNQVFYDELPVPKEDLIGEEGKGFRYILDSMNPERFMVGAQSIGVGRAALKRAARYAKERVVFGRPIGMNQAIQHPLAESWCKLEAAAMMVYRAASLFDQDKPCGAESNAAKWLGAEAGFEACEKAIMTHGGMGYAKEFHVERYLREVQILRIGPIPPPLILSYIAERVLELPKSY